MYFFYFLFKSGYTAYCPIFVRNNRNGHAIYRSRIIFIKVWHFYIKNSLSAHPTFFSPLSDKEIIVRLRPIAMSFFKSKRSRCIQMSESRAFTESNKPPKNSKSGCNSFPRLKKAERRDGYHIPIKFVLPHYIRIDSFQDFHLRSKDQSGNSTCK